LLQESNMRLLHGEFGPKRELEHYWVRPFLVAKVGSDKFFLDLSPATFNCLSSASHHLHVKTVSSVVYPGGGLEGRDGDCGWIWEIKCTSTPGRTISVWRTAHL
jgi:hypothetical protein